MAHSNLFRLLILYIVFFGFFVEAAVQQIQSEGTIIGRWHFKTMYCSAEPVHQLEPKNSIFSNHENMQLRPINGSEFEPDMYLDFRSLQLSPMRISKEKTTYFIQLKKSVTTRSCPKLIPLNLTHETLFSQIYNEKVLIHQNEFSSGVMKGLSIGATWGNPKYSTLDCDNHLFFFQTLFGVEDHIKEEFNRIYYFKILQGHDTEGHPETRLALSYQETSFISKMASKCPQDSFTVLEFTKLSDRDQAL